MIRGFCCSKSRLAKAEGAEAAVPQTGEKSHAAVAKSAFASQNAQNTTFSDPFWKFRCSKNGTRLWREAHLASKNVQNTSWPDHFLTFRCRKMARRCGAKHICKSKCTKHLIVGAILEVLIRKNGTPLWREAHL